MAGWWSKAAQSSIDLPGCLTPAAGRLVWIKPSFQIPKSPFTSRCQINGFAGCNDYSGTVSSGEYGLNSLEVSPIAATQSLCPDPVSAQENTYLTRLGSVELWHYDYGHLSLVYKLEEDVFGELQFTPQQENMTNTNQIKPNEVTELEDAYGAPSQAGFGSAVFYEQLEPADDLGRWRSRSTSISSASCGSATARMPGWGRGKRSTPARAMHSMTS